MTHRRFTIAAMAAAAFLATASLAAAPDSADHSSGGKGGPESGGAPAQVSPLDGRVLIEFPGDSGITLAIAFERDCRYRVLYGESRDRLDRETPERAAAAGTVSRERISGLKPGTAYWYSLAITGVSGVSPASSSATGTDSAAASFTTRRAPGDSFSFVVEADPHLDGNSSGPGYLAALKLMAADKPDFAVDLGDSSMAEKLAGNRDEVIARLRLLRSYWDEIGSAVPIFMVAGNHDGEQGWRPRLDFPDGDEIAALRRIWLTDPRSASGDGYDVLTERVYAFQWGDALIVALDPYSAESEKPERGWDWTLGKEQYEWLERVLSRSAAKYRFVFIHNLVGGIGRDARGGADAAALYEWGGADPEGGTFADRRPGWNRPIAELLRAHGVQAVFHGHDHFYAREECGGIVYQLVPQPSLERAQRLDSSMIAEYGYAKGDFLPSPGYLTISVSPERALVELRSAADGSTLRSYPIAPWTEDAR